MAKINLPKSPTAPEPKSLRAQRPKRPRLVFFGTPDYVIPVLEALKGAGHEISAVVTQPPKPVGRKGVLTPSPAALWAQRHGIAVFDGKPKKIVGELRILNAELGLLGAYGRILPPELLTIFPHGILNIHPSLLPKYRGASPVQAAIAAGDKQTGVTIIKLDEEMDHGPITAQFTEDIKDDDTAGTLRERLFQKAADALPKILYRYIAMEIKPQEQNHTEATYTTLLKKEHGFIPPKYIEAAVQGDPLHKEEWQIPFIKGCIVTPDAQHLERFIRAMSPWPGAWTEVKLGTRHEELGTRRLKILKAHVEKIQEPKSPRARLVPDLVQLEGKNPVSWEEFKKGYPEAKF